MSRIQVLDKQTAEMIAAGEVVERPSSVIKELVENAVDAGATSIAVEIKNGGITLMRVTDNGSGITRDDVRTAFLRHATSKLRTADDLDAIGTLGFRGEALASIGAVSRVELITRFIEEETGTLYKIEGGEEIECSETGCPTGSTMLVKDLFYNVPARMKFLKKDQTEANAVAGVLDRVALSHPEISFSFIRDGKKTLHTPGDGKLLSAIHAVYGKEFAGGLIPVEYRQGGLRIEGYISKPAASRKNRNMQHFYINGRYVKTRTAMAALEQAYKNAIMTGNFPACVLNLAVPLSAVDVNVHPAKIEVRFSDEKPIFQLVYYGVKSALSKKDDRPELLLKIQDSDKKQSAPFSGPALTKAAKVIRETNNKPKNPWSEILGEKGIPLSAVNRPEQNDTMANFDGVVYKSGRNTNIDIFVDEDIIEPKKQPESKKDLPGQDLPFEAPEPPQPCEQAEKHDPVQQKLEETQQNVRVLGEVFRTYILAEDSDILYIIDKHAAHERILFEQFKKGQDELSVQYLLSPVVVTLEKGEYDLLLENSTLIEQAGFVLEDFGGSVLVRAVPMILPHADVKAMIEEIAGRLSSSERTASTEKMDFIFHSVACRAAVKAGDGLSMREMQDLAQQALKDDQIRYCPHGRPVAYRLSKKEIEKQFGRIQ